MNQSYRLVWNRVRNAWMVVGECARSMGKGGGTARRAARRQPRGSLAAMVNRVGAFGWAGVIGMVGLLGTPLAWSQAARVSSVSSLPPAQLAPPAVNALPQGAQVLAGQVQIQQAVNQLTVQQQSSKAIINWQSCDIGQQATVQFQQPGSDAVALNRVQSGTASQIYGKLVANGQVFLLNANGVLFGPDAQVDVGALVAGAMRSPTPTFWLGG